MEIKGASSFYDEVFYVKEKLMLMLLTSDNGHLTK